MQKDNNIKPNRYANEIPFIRDRSLTDVEHLELENRLKRDLSRHSLAYRFGLFSFFICISAITIILILAHVFGLTIESSGTKVFLFCFFFPALAGNLQEILFPYIKMNRFIFAFPISYAIFRILGPEDLKSDLLLILACLIFIFGGLILLLLRTSDAKKNLPKIKNAIKDLDAYKVLCFHEAFELEGKTEEISLEILPISHVIYSLNGALISTWKTANVVEIIQPPSHEYLAPWHNAPPKEFSESLIFFQRKMSDIETEELVKIRKKLMKFLPVVIACSFYLSFFFTHWLEKLIRWDSTSNFSKLGIITALLIALIYPIKSFLHWRRLGKDLKAKLIISAWEKNNDTSETSLLEEALPVSGILWSHRGKPSSWRF